MDPPHITEFASQRYFEKLRQLSESKDEVHDSVAHPHDGCPVAQSSTFILPIGQSRLLDQQKSHVHQKTEKRRTNFSLRTILPTRGSAEHERRNVLLESPQKKRYDSYRDNFVALRLLNHYWAVSRLTNYFRTSRAS